MNLNQTPMISIIIPAYNEEKHIEACLTSIFNVDYPKAGYEIILVDNGSTDRTREIAGQFDIAIFTDQDKNVSGLRNLGVKYAKGEILAFIDADCLATHQWLKNASLHIQNNKLAAWGAPPEIPDNPTWVQEAWFAIRKNETGIGYVHWLESMNLFVRKDYFINIGGFNESLATCEDVDFCYRIARYGKILSDTAIKTIHLGEAHDVKTFFAKELWRGQSNLQGLWSHGLHKQELPSLLIPVYFGVFIPILMLISSILGNKYILMSTVFLLFSPAIGVLHKKKNKLNIHLMFNLFLLLQVYFFARTVAVVKKTI